MKNEIVFYFSEFYTKHTDTESVFNSKHTNDLRQRTRSIIADIDDDVVNRTLSVRSPLDVVSCKIVLIFAMANANNTRFLIEPCASMSPMHFYNSSTTQYFTKPYRKIPFLCIFFTYRKIIIGEFTLQIRSIDHFRKRFLCTLHVILERR